MQQVVQMLTKRVLGFCLTSQSCEFEGKDECRKRMCGKGVSCLECTFEDSRPLREMVEDRKVIGDR